MSKDIKIGLFGFGCVGQGLHDVLNNSKGITADIHKIAVKDRNKKRKLDASYFTYTKEEILENPDLNVIVELIDDAEVAYNIVSSALKSGKEVVSANKKLVAEHLEEFVLLQQETGSSLLYEGAVCGSIPIIRTIEEYYNTELLYSVSGIFNGSSNYILSKVFEEGLSYEVALKQAQDLGFAETDPTLDVGGFDAKYKLVILTAHSFGLIVKPEEVFNYGIQNLSPFDMQYAREKGLKIKLVPKVKRVSDNEITLYVIPQFVKEHDYLYEVENEYNGVTVAAAFSEKQFFRGKGAGGHPTGSAVLSDIAALRYGYGYEYRKYHELNGLKYTTDVDVKVFFRYLNKEQFVREQFISVEEKYESEAINYVTGSVKLSSLLRSDYFQQEGTFLVEMPD
ncbi:homoserine dehydrogenase [Flammeovirgaceae bacterium SG7u.111]|nr:homoserine dehydrogenase [Flammeovirgaceae bacterium SG7u.132]WPO35100.1 homoserine dehydrogenase [Flammeovirgaceae bacterium SG7u.111]